MLGMEPHFVTWTMDFFHGLYFSGCRGKKTTKDKKSLALSQSSFCYNSNVFSTIFWCLIKKKNLSPCNILFIVTVLSSLPRSWGRTRTKVSKSILSKFSKIIKRRQPEAWLLLAFRRSWVDGVRAWSSTVHVINWNFCAADFDTKTQFF